MTTTVTVSAHCDADTTEVQVLTQLGAEENASEEGPVDILQDGETMDFTVYDDRVIQVMEVQKQPDSGE